MLWKLTLAFLGAPLFSPAYSQDTDKAPVPTAQEQTDAEHFIKELFKDDYAKRSPADKIALAKKMLAQAIQTKDDPRAQFVLFREARDLCSQGGDILTGMVVIDEMARRFAIDPAAMKGSLLAIATRTAKSPEDFKTLAIINMKLAEPLITADDYDGADKLMATAVAQALKSKDTGLALRANTRTKDLADLKAKFEKVKKAKDLLATDPAEPAANLAVGRFQCFVKDNWAGGLPYLAKGSDPGLRLLAERELLNPAGESELVALGDAWWELADKEPAPGKGYGKDHAAVLYNKALPKVAGIVRAKAEKRLSEAGALRLGKGTWIDVTDPKNFSMPGKPGDPLELIAKPGGSQSNPLVHFPKGDFDGFTVRATLNPATSVMAWVYYDPTAYAAVVDAGGGNFCNTSDRVTQWYPIFTMPWPKNTESVITVIIEDGEYVLYLDHRERTRAKTTNTRLIKLILEARNGAVKFDRIQFRKAE